ncbi:MAG: hypothetical protein ACYCZR_01085 [Burkholderiales bacterium]
MADVTWVQSKYNKDAEKWEVRMESGYEWCVMPKEPKGHGYHYLPKSEYVRCSPPEWWERVAAQLRPSKTSSCVTYLNDTGIMIGWIQFTKPDESRYRVVSVVLEKRVEP